MILEALTIPSLAAAAWLLLRGWGRRRHLRRLRSLEMQAWSHWTRLSPQTKAEFLAAQGTLASAERQASETLLDAAFIARLLAASSEETRHETELRREALIEALIEALPERPALVAMTRQAFG